jgi:hypothetical protein
MMATRGDQEMLQLSDGWLELGVLTEEQLASLAQEFAVGDDPNPEHYRYRVFREYLESRRPLPADTAEALYELGAADPDRAMGQAMMHDVVNLPECPETVREKAAASGERHLARLVHRKRLLARADAGLTAEVFEECLAAGDAVVQRELLARAALSREQLEQLAADGGNRAVRNLAAAQLRSRRREQ